MQTCIFLGSGQPLEHIVTDDSDSDTVPSEQSHRAWYDMCALSLDVAKLCFSLHWCTPSIQTPSSLWFAGSGAGPLGISPDVHLPEAIGRLECTLPGTARQLAHMFSFIMLSGCTDVQMELWRKCNEIPQSCASSDSSR